MDVPESAEHMDVFIITTDIRGSLMSDSCVTAPELLCKHVRATKIFYFDLNEMPTGVTASNPVVEASDSYVTVGTPEIIATNVTVERPEPCQDVTLIAGRAIKFTLSGGVSSDDEASITAEWDQSNGEHGTAEGRLIVSGVA